MAMVAALKVEKSSLFEFENLIREMVQQGRLLALFKFLMKAIRDLSDSSIKSELIERLIGLLKDACDVALKCENCHASYRFRHCINPLEAKKDGIHAIELSWDCCGDYFTYAENRERVSYFNFFVLKKVDNFRRRARGLTIKVMLGGLAEPALLKVEHNERTTSCSY